ncbi:putative anti-sigma regulatory factor, serine/threonine protein kinase [Catenulispora acidiphila DSM 44928]|uniref:Putative anti-sigma regulatory factor, serine/threonine protein kinase n=1 Tax=Catenulispora acidiphila (strain DSM 44928 / JCM 14897 / NBRC 102108 / NRRL B-24433 / ID139908) TaxID=479433 RepID=C7PXT4_CATAD|nr:putative anti-sigma regulatory factor, serine/threonine protein kinase [Catenulispora acidiphila DSM 44928]
MSGSGWTERSLVLPPQASAPQLARDFVVETVSAWQLQESEEAVALITSELVTNAVRHAGTEVTVRIRKDASEITIDVADGVADRVPRVSSSDASIPGGVGLLIVGRLAESWGVERRRNGKSVWVRLALDSTADRL